jgi:hypothetical protein
MSVAHVLEGPNRGSAERPKLVFVHVPKAAGTTLTTVVRRPYPNDQIHVIQGRIVESLAGLTQMEPHARSRIRCLYGHLPFGAHMLTGPVEHMTMLRDPIDRLVSHYHYARSQPAMYLHELSLRSDLAAYVSSGAAELDNGQTRLLSGLADVDAVRGDGPVTGAVLQEAQGNLATAVIGLTEAFDESLLHFRRAFGWRNVLYSRQNATPQRPPKAALSKDVRAFLEERQGFDRRLYDAAVAQFRRQREKFGVTRGQIAALRWLNALYGSLRRTRLRRSVRTFDAGFESLQRRLL